MMATDRIFPRDFFLYYLLLLENFILDYLMNAVYKQ